MDRNIITGTDAERARKAAYRRIEARKAGEPQPNAVPLRAGEPVPMGSELDIDTKSDQWFQRLAKYVPSEAIGLYLALAGLFTPDEAARHGLLLLTTLVAVSVIFNTIFLRRIWRVRRWTQIVVSDVALLTFIFATGGLLIQQLSFYGPRTATVVLVVTTAFLVFIEPPSDQSGTTSESGPQAADTAA